MSLYTSDIVKVKKGSRSDQPLEQRTFVRLRKKIENLHQQEEKRIKDLDKAIEFYLEKIQPLEDSITNLYIQRARIGYKFYKKGIKLSHSERRTFKELILDDLEEVFLSGSLADAPEDTKNIFRELQGYEYGEVVEKELGKMKSELEEMFKENLGVDIDLSAIEPGLREDEIMQKIFQSFGEAVDKKERPSSKRKTKKQLENELKQNQMEELQKKSLNSIFRQLAKVLHPDLESDPAKKTEKEQLMKQVTAAYEKEDLHTLLSLEQIWLKGLQPDDHKHSLEQLKIYNEVLKEQVRDLEDRIHFLWNSPKYFYLHKFYPGGFAGLWPLQKSHEELIRKEKYFREFISNLSGPEAVSIIRQAIQENSASFQARKVIYLT